MTIGYMVKAIPSCLCTYIVLIPQLTEGFSPLYLLFDLAEFFGGGGKWEVGLVRAAHAVQQLLSGVFCPQLDPNLLEGLLDFLP